MSQRGHGRRGRGSAGGRGGRGGQRRQVGRGQARSPLTWDQIRASSDRGILLSSEHLVQDLVLTFRPRNDIATELLRQVDLAHRMNDIGWLSTVAWEAQEVWGRGWIETNIGPIPDRTKKVTESTACRVDIRKKTDPTLESRIENASDRDQEIVHEVVHFLEHDLEEAIRDAAASSSRRSPSPKKRSVTQSETPTPSKTRTVTSTSGAAVANSAPSLNREWSRNPSPRGRSRDESEGSSPDRKRRWRHERGSASSEGQKGMVSQKGNVSQKSHAAASSTSTRPSLGKKKTDNGSRAADRSSAPRMEENYSGRGGTAAASSAAPYRGKHEARGKTADSSSSTSRREERSMQRRGTAAARSASISRRDKSLQRTTQRGPAAASSASVSRRERSLEKRGTAAVSSASVSRRYKSSDKKGGRAADRSPSTHKKRERSLGRTGERAAASSSSHTQQSSTTNRPGKKNRGKRGKKADQPCPIPWCQGNYKFPKVHVLEYHYPTKLDARASHSQQATRDRIEALEYLASVLIGPTATIVDLMVWLNEGQTVDRPGRVVDEFTEAVVDEVARALGLDAPRYPTLAPLNAPGCLFHWSVMVMVLRLLTRSQHHLFMRLFSHEARHDELAQRIPRSPSPEGRDAPDMLVCVRPRDGERVVRFHEFGDRPTLTVEEYVPQEQEELLIDREREEEPMEDTEGSDAEPGEDVEDVYGVDSHFHMDRLCRNLRAPEYGLRRVMSMCKPWDERDRVEVRGGVAVFCDPPSYPSAETIQFLKSEGVATAIGLHPLLVGEANQQTLDRLRDLTRREDVAGLGEIGLDTRADLHRQRQKLDMVLDFLLPHHVLILHCRADNYRRRADLFASLFFQCRGKIPASSKIHLHCFNGDRDAVRMWTSHFPNVHFGFSRMVENFDEDSVAAVREIGASQLLIETDAPYFPCRGYSNSSPAFIGMTAALVATIRGQTRDEVLRLTARNARRLYWA